MNTPREPSLRPQELRWTGVDTVLLDLDGTLLDKYFDDYFWEHYVPEVYAEKNGLEGSEAKAELLRRYRSVERTLNWSDIDYWSDQLDLDIPQLKRNIDHLIRVHPYVVDFLDFLRQAGKNIHLVTAAHRETLRIKMEKTMLSPRFDRIVCAGDVEEPKESGRFWQRLETILDFDPDRTLLCDDTAAVLRAARASGIAHLVLVAKPSSRAPALNPEEFCSILSFKELLC